MTKTQTNTAAERSTMTRWRAASLIGVHVLIGLHFAHWKIAGRTLAPVEPSEMFDTLHLGIVTVGFLFMAGIVFATSIAGRFFCSWGCHILALQDLCAAILKKLRIPTKPIRSRTLIWVPLAAVLYLFVWPQVQRWLQGGVQPSLHVITDPNGWTSFTTTDLLRSFPGLGMTLFTFAVCGFVIVYFLGSRSFCSYACPYGAIFAAAERIAPLRIIAGSGECSQCGLCVSSCKSSIKVVNEVQEFGTVMSSYCMRDLDCVSVCPTDALKLGITTPPVFRSWREPRTLKKQYDFSLGEDLLLAGVFVAVLPIIRGLYDAVSFLLALAVSAILAYFAVVALRLVRRDRVTFSNIELKQQGKLTSSGWKFAGLAIALGVFVVHSTYIRYHVFAGEMAFSQVAATDTAVTLPNNFTNEGDDIAKVRNSSNELVRAKALYHFERAFRWGLFRPGSLSRRLAVSYQMNGSDGEARNCLQTQLMNDPEDLESRLLFGHSWLQEGQLDLAKKHLSMVTEAGSRGSRPSRSLYEQRIQAAAHSLQGDVEVQSGHPSEAIVHFRKAIEENPNHADAYLGLSAMLAAQGQLQEAVELLTICAKVLPDSPEVHNNLGIILTQLDRLEEALYHCQHAAALMPGHPWTRCNVGTALLRLDRLDEAEEAFEEALALQADFPDAVKGLEQIRQRRGTDNP